MLFATSCVIPALNPRNFSHGSVDPDDPGKPVKSPIPYNQKTIAGGKQLFDQHCVRCHGKSGIGNGPEAKEITPKPSNLTKVSNPSDTYLFKKISIGNDEMPTWNIELKEKEIWLLTHYIKSFNKVPMEKKPVKK